MTTRNNRSPRQFLAREIQRAREAKGMSREELGKAVFVSESLVRSWERGRRLPKPDNLKDVERVLGFGNGKDPGILSRIREDLINAAVPLEWFGRWQEIESQSMSLWTFEPLLIPGLLQIEAYATVVLRAANHIADLEDMGGRTARAATGPHQGRCADARGPDCRGRATA